MELSIRDWMVVIGVLLLLAVGLDGYRRSKKERKNRVRLSKTARRRARQAGPQQDSDCTSDVQRNEKVSKLGNSDLGISKKAIVEPLEKRDNSELIQEYEDEDSVSSLQSVDGRYDVDPLFENPFEVEAHRLPNVDDLSVQPASADVQASVEPEPEPIEELLESEQEFQHSLVFGSDRAENAVEPDEILVLNVLATDSQGFSGEDLLHILRACDCRIGDMNIFHRYESEGAKGRVQFSIVNMVEPGVFNLEDIKAFSTPGVSFFLRLPGPAEPTEAYNCMVEVAQCLVRNLGGELKDDMLSTVTEQTLSHNKQRIRDYQQRQLLTD